MFQLSQRYVGLDRAASDLDIWQRCQDEGYILIEIDAARGTGRLYLP